MDSFETKWNAEIKHLKVVMGARRFEGLNETANCINSQIHIIESMLIDYKQLLMNTNAPRISSSIVETAYQDHKKNCFTGNTTREWCWFCAALADARKKGEV